MEGSYSWLTPHVMSFRISKHVSQIPSNESSNKMTTKKKNRREFFTHSQLNVRSLAMELIYLKWDFRWQKENFMFQFVY